MTFSFSTCILFLTNASLTFLSIYWAARAWASYREARTEQPWKRTNCTILSKHAKNRSFNYCPAFSVVNFTKPSSPPADAYRHGFPIFNETRNSTNEYLALFDINETYPCWLSSSPDAHISLSAVPIGPDSHDVNVAAISTVLALAAAVSFTAISYLLCMSQPPLVGDDFPIAPAYVARPGLSMEAIDAIMEAAEQADESCSRHTSDDTCAICLEAGLGARLACGHAFHSHCIRAWLSRGGETCPLCCAVVCAPAGVAVGGRGYRGDMMSFMDVERQLSMGMERQPSMGASELIAAPNHGVAALLRQGRHSAPPGFFDEDASDLDAGAGADAGASAGAEAGAAGESGEAVSSGRDGERDRGQGRERGRLGGTERHAAVRRTYARLPSLAEVVAGGSGNGERAGVVCDNEGEGGESVTATPTESVVSTVGARVGSGRDSSLEGDDCGEEDGKEEEGLRVERNASRGPVLEVTAVVSENWGEEEEEGEECLAEILAITHVESITESVVLGENETEREGEKDDVVAESVGATGSGNRKSAK